MTEASLEQDLTAARHEHLVPGREIHAQEMHGHPFCEAGLVTELMCFALCVGQRAHTLVSLPPSARDVREWIEAEHG